MLALCALRNSKISITAASGKNNAIFHIVKPPSRSAAGAPLKTLTIIRRRQHSLGVVNNSIFLVYGIARHRDDINVSGSLARHFAAWRATRYARGGALSRGGTCAGDIAVRFITEHQRACGKTCLTLCGAS